MRNQSKKRATENQQRRSLLAEAYRERPPCAVPWCTALADDAHEMLTRARGGSITDLANIAPLCRPHHDEITFREPLWAYALGLLRSSHPDDPGVFARPAHIDRMGRTHQARSSLAEKLWAGIDASQGPESCWPWTRGCNPKGYGRITGGALAHRVAYRVAKGYIAGNLQVQHLCDNPPCCNPAHLSAGTAAANSAQMRERGRSPKPWGEKSGKAVLSNAEVEMIRKMAAAGVPRMALAESFRVHPTHISRICSGQRRQYG